MSVSVRSQDLGAAARQEENKKGKKKRKRGRFGQAERRTKAKSGAMRSEAWDRKASKSISLALLGLRVAQGQSGSR